MSDRGEGYEKNQAPNWKGLGFRLSKTTPIDTNSRRALLGTLGITAPVHHLHHGEMTQTCPTSPNSKAEQHLLQRVPPVLRTKTGSLETNAKAWTSATQGKAEAKAY